LNGTTEECDGGDLISEIDKEVSRAEVAVEDGDHVLPCNLLDDEVDTELEGALDLVSLIERVKDRDVGHWHIHETGKHGEHALSKGAAPNKENATVEGDHAIAQGLASLATLVAQNGSADKIVQAQVKLTRSGFNILRGIDLA